jgi:Xaa-Pro aminopeptidase
VTGSTEDRARKRERMQRMLRERGAEQVVLTSHEALAWYLEGARTHVSLAGPPVLAVRARLDGDELFVAANEAARLAAEELLPEDAARITRVPWDEPVAAAVEGAPESEFAAELRAIRASLLPAERQRYRQLGADTARVLTTVLSRADPAQTENGLAADAAGALRAAGIDPLVVLVAGAGRLPFRHPLPTDAALGERAMLVVCGKRHGLIANATRWIATEEAAAAAEDGDRRIREVEAAFFAATRPGATLDAVFAAGTAGYAAAGFAADEWRNHHQGGAAGYAGRDPRATSKTRDLVQDAQAFAWNPSAPGAKIEDTVVVSAGGIEVLTRDEEWPTVDVAGLPRPRTLVYGERAAAASMGAW